MDKNAKIFIAGSTGMLGTALLRKLKEKEYTNILVTKREELDLLDKKQVFDFFDKNKPEYVFLAAGMTGGIVANKTFPADFLHTNIAIQDHLFEAAQKYQVKHLIFYGSSCMYPKLSPQPMKEEYFLTGAIEPTSEAYGAAKIAGTIACKAYNNQYNTNRFIALIPNSMYGPNDNFDLENSHVLSALIRKFHDAKVKQDNNEEAVVKLWGTGSPRREFVYVDDISDASIFIMNNANELENSHYNIGSGVDYSIKELANIIAEIVGYKNEIEWDADKPDGAPKKLLDSSKFKKLGWNSQTNIEEGIQTTYKWFLENTAPTL